MGNQDFPTNRNIKTTFFDKLWGSLNSSSWDVPRPFEKKSCKLSKTVLASAWKQEKRRRWKIKVWTRWLWWSWEGHSEADWARPECPNHIFPRSLPTHFFLFDIFTPKIHILVVDCVHDDDNRREEEWCDEADVALVRSLKGCRFFSRGAYGRHLSLCPNALKVSPQ